MRPLPGRHAVDLEIHDSPDSARHKRGNRFAMRLAAPLAVDGRTTIARHTPAVRQIAHASPGLAGGTPGELLVAARHVTDGERQVALRGPKLGVSGAVSGMKPVIGTTSPVLPPSKQGYAASAGSRSLLSGRVTVNVVPTASLEAALMVLPTRSAISRAIWRPGLPVGSDVAPRRCGNCTNRLKIEAVES